MDSNQTPPPPPPPPPLSPPPPIQVPVTPARGRKKGRGWMVVAIVLLVLLGFSLLMNFSQWANGLPMTGSSRMAGPRLDEVLLEDNRALNKIAVVDVRGIITSDSLDHSGFTMADLIRAQLDRAHEDNRVKAVLLRVDSPGGEVLASDEINRAIRDFQDESGKPVIASMGNLAASGGYYVSAPCRWIVANELTITGSIGVILQSWNYRGLADKVGLLPHIYKSGRFKDMLSGSRLPSQIPPEEHEMVQNLIDETYSRFKEIVAEGRNHSDRDPAEAKPLAPDWADYADGRILSGAQAYQLGFVDQLGNFQDAVEQAKRLVGITDANLIQYQQRYGLADFLGVFGKSEKAVVKVDLGIEAPKLRTGQLYFLPPTYLH